MVSVVQAKTFCWKIYDGKYISLNYLTESCVKLYCRRFIQVDPKKRELLKNPTKIEEIQQKNFIDRNITITTCLLRDSNPNYQCLKITSCRWRPSLRMQYFNLLLRFPIARCSLATLRIGSTRLGQGHWMN
jgi:hypothetical protein